MQLTNALSVPPARPLSWFYSWSIAGIRHAWRRRQILRHAIGDALWQSTLRQFAFLPRNPAHNRRLRELATLFLRRKRFSGAQGLQVTDAMAVAVAAQAALMLLGRSLLDEQVNANRAFDALDWFDNSVGVVLHPGPMLSLRSTADGSGLVHEGPRVLLGESMAGGPVTLSWADVKAASGHAERGSNLVLHEFAHVLDAARGHANGAPPLPTDFAPYGLNFASAQAAHAAWAQALSNAYALHSSRCEQAAAGLAVEPWLDAYAATAPEEFFAVTVEAYLVNPRQFAAEMPNLMPWYDAVFHAYRWQSRY